MFMRVLKHEIRAMFRDKMYAFLLFYPIIMAIAAYILTPILVEQQNPLLRHILTLFFITMNGFMFGAITGFTLLDDQDDHVLFSLKITPIKVKDYILIKLAISYVLGVFATLLIMITSGFIAYANPLNSLYIIILTPLHGPIIALLVNAFAHNKVEGFVIMKTSGLILIAPIAALFLTDWKELFLSILPGFWPVRLISFELVELPYFLKNITAYFLLGVIINSLIIYVFYRIYKKRIAI